MDKIKLFHDFNTLLDSEKEGYAIAPLICNGTTKQIEDEGITLYEGQKLTLINLDGMDANGIQDRLEVDAIIHFDGEKKQWFGEFIYSELKYKSEK